jgi:hypothetical protein
MNPRSRSARLRFGRRTQAPALGLEGAWSKLAALPSRQNAPARQKKGR